MAMRKIGKIMYDMYGNARVVPDEIGAVRKNTGSYLAGMGQVANLADMNVPMGGGPVDGRTNVPNMNPSIYTPPTSDVIATKQQFTEADNTVAAGGAAGILSTNIAGVLSPIFGIVVPQNERWHFKPQIIQGVDENITTMFMRLVSNTTTGAWLRGYYQITLFNTRRTAIKGVIGSGALQKFGQGNYWAVAAPFGGAVGNLTDIRQRIYYDRDIVADQGDVIVISINSPVVLAPGVAGATHSQITCEYICWSP